MRWIRWIAAATLFAALLVLVAGPLNRVGVNFRTTLGLLRYATLASGAGALFCLGAMLLARRRGARSEMRLATIGLVAGLIAFLVPMALLAKARSVPPIHDISTDTLDPPQFVALLLHRAGAMNPADYAGAQVAAQQIGAYPTIRTLVLDMPPDQAYARALAAVGALGWTIVAAVPGEGRIEATDTTAWFGFKDDIVVRIRAQDGASRIDIRSKSRVGVSDLGANAERIGQFLERMQS